MSELLTGDMVYALSFPRALHTVDIQWAYLERHLADLESVGFEIYPEYQRGHVWTQAQQAAYIEHVMLGGETAREVIVVRVGSRDATYSKTTTTRSGLVIQGYSMLDGLQRVTAVRALMRGEFPVLTCIRPHGFRWSEFDPGAQRQLHMRFHVREVAVPTQADVLELYLRLNSAGTQHSAKELGRVRAMLEKIKQ